MPEGVVLVTASGTIRFEGSVLAPDAAAQVIAARDRAAGEAVRIVADRQAPAATVVSLVSRLSGEGLAPLAIVTTRSEAFP